MMRRIGWHSVAIVASTTYYGVVGAAQQQRRGAVATHVRDDLTRVATRVKDECGGQALDIAEMADSSRAVAKAVTDVATRYPDGAGDAKVKGKMSTLVASLKAYQARLGNVQSEAKSLQREADSLVKHLWGTTATDEEQHQRQQQPGTTSGTESTGDFGVDVPPIARALDGDKTEAEAVRDASTGKSGAQLNEEEVVIEVLEPDAPDDRDSDKYADVPVTTITQYLYERGIDFSDCKDAAMLRRRYADVLAGKFSPQEPPRPTSNQRAPPPPPRPTQQQQQQYNQQTETGLAFDPHPGAMRKMLDPMKAVWEIKQQLAREQGLAPESIDLWSGAMKLEDHKRLYEYGAGLQANPIEIRSKGDVPTYKP